MFILRNSGGICATNSYLVGDESSKQAVIFDAPDHTVAPLVEEVERRHWDLIGLWLTHGHFDHVADHAVVTARFPKASVLMHRLDEPKLIDPVSRFFQLPFVIPPRKADAYIEDGQHLAIGTLGVDVIHTPGHAPGHVMFHFPEQQVLIGGDLIIMGAVGRTDLPDANHAALEESIRRVMRLPGGTRLLPGHGESSTLDEERRLNPYVVEALNE